MSVSSKTLNMIGKDEARDVGNTIVINHAKRNSAHFSQPGGKSRRRGGGGGACGRCRIPALLIFVLSALLCTVIAVASGIAMYYFTINILEDSVKREGANQADAIGARVSALFENVEKTRNVTIGQVMSQGGAFDADVLDDPDTMRTLLNATYGMSFTSEAVGGRVQGMEVACLLPSNITENAEATGFAILSIYSEVLKSGGRVYTRMLSSPDGIGFDEYYIQFADTTATGSELMASVYQGPLRSSNTSDATFIDGYQSDYADSDYFYFDGFTGPDGFGYFYATSYKYFFAGHYLCEVSAYQLVDSWYTYIRDSLKDAPDTQIAIVDGIDQYVLASTFSAERKRISECYPNVSMYWEDNDGDCIKKSFKDLGGTPKLVSLISSVYEDSWAELELAIPTTVSKRDVSGEKYFVVVKQLGNINYLRPFLIWARPVEAVISDLRRTTIIIVVCSSSAILLAMLLVAGCTAFMLLRPMKALEEKMQRLTRLEDVSLDSFSDMDTDDDAFDSLHIDADEDQHQKHLRESQEMEEVASARRANRKDGETDSDSLFSDSATVKALQKGKSRSGNSFIREVGDLQYHFNAMGRALHSFTKYVPRDVVNELMITGQVATSGMRERRLTIMFVDIAGFTTMCEALNSPSVISNLLTKFFSINTQRLHAHGATIDKFIGDCIMCFWGAPIRIDNPNFRALCAGLDLQRTARELNDIFISAGAALDVRVGCHTGYVLVGNIGSDDRINYTAMGDAVNSASRLEGANKRFSSSFLASEEVLRGSKRAHMFATRYVGGLVLKGKHNKVVSHHICGTTFTSSNSMLDEQLGLSPTHGGRGSGSCDQLQPPIIQQKNLPVETAVTRVRHGTHSLTKGYDTVALHCHVSPSVATACSLFGFCVNGGIPPPSPSAHHYNKNKNTFSTAASSFGPSEQSPPSNPLKPPLLIPVSNFQSDSIEEGGDGPPPGMDMAVSPSMELPRLERGDFLALDREFERLLGSEMYERLTDDNGVLFANTTQVENGHAHGHDDDDDYGPTSHMLGESPGPLRDNEQDYAIIKSLRLDLRRRLAGRNGGGGADEE